MNEFKPYINTLGIEDFFEGFKPPSEYILFGSIPNFELNMNDFNSNLILLKKPIDKGFLEDIISFYEYRTQDEKDGQMSLITKVENDSHIMIMTFVESDENYCLHHNVKLDNAVQLLDDATSTNDCVRALQELHLLKDYKHVEEKEFEQIELLVKSQLSPQGWREIEQFAPELLTLEELSQLKKPKNKM